MAQATAGVLPFWIEGPIPPTRIPDYFRGRAEEVERLAKRWGQRAPARSVLIAPARTGKRSLVHASLAATAAEVTPLQVPADRLLPETGHGLARSLLELVHARAPHPALPRLARQLSHGPPEAPVEVIHALGEHLARVPGRPLVILDGAHALDRLDDATLLALDTLAAASRAHFLSLLDHLPPGLPSRLPTLLGPSGVRVSRLAPLSRREAATFLVERFRLAGVEVAPDALSLLLDYASGDPASVQLLGARCHDVMLRRRRNRLSEDEVAEGIFLALDSLPPEWTRVLGRLEGRARDAFVALAILEDPTVSRVGERIHLDAKNVSVVLSRLAERGAPIEKTGRGRWRITHRLLAEWVRKEWTPRDA